MSTYTARLAALTHDFLFTAFGEGVTILQAWATLNLVLPRPYCTRLKAVRSEEEETNSCWPHDLHLITPTIWSHMALMLLPCLLYYVGFNYCVSCLSWLPFAEGSHSQKFRHLKWQWNIYCILGVTKASIIDGGNEGTSLALSRNTKKWNRRSWCRPGVAFMWSPENES